ncbi:hypothetical protein PCASD_24385 [Puccinia coronata f. sp. avenae]|uniref:serine C-palmitoyltransferase n=1 Tax=Puccinia coronata f. sp. avenae TaxID=200324 RepID=A0A2N5TQP1_9BASI|nr:hypothetical protein PCASD_24385 [Puccinia coronata f. sp. avenae]
MVQPKHLLQQQRESQQSHHSQQSQSVDSTSDDSDSVLVRRFRPTHHQHTHHPDADQHAEFGFDHHNQQHRYISQFRPILKQTALQQHHHQQQHTKHDHDQDHIFHIDAQDILTQDPEEPGYWVYLSTYLSYLILILLGHVRDFFGKRFKSTDFRHLMPQNGYAALNSDFDSFLHEAAQGAYGGLLRAAGDGGGGTNDQAHGSVQGICHGPSGTHLTQLSVSVGGAREDVGSLELHVRWRETDLALPGREETMIISQGFATNSTTFPAIASKGTLIISDEFNHSSIRFGCRLSGGNGPTHRPWKKIIVVVEGIYSMEGTIVNLPELYALKAIYKFYLYVDEAHSIGALGPHGKGVCDYFGLDPAGIDIMMGTLTKSFGASGGYIAGKAEIINALRATNHSSVYGESMSPPVIQQIVSSLTLIAGLEEKHDDASPEGLDTAAVAVVPKVPEGKERLRRLAFNARYLSSGLRKLGFIVYGDRDSPIIPLLIFHPGKMLQFSRMMLERYAIVVVVVAYPATPLVSSRVRFCVSASHTKEDIDRILVATDQIGELLGLKMSRRNGFISSPFLLDHHGNKQIVNLDGNLRWDIHTVLNNSLLLVQA